MERQIVLVSHGTMAEGMYRAAKMVFGELPGVDYVCLSEEKGIDQFEAEMRVVMESLNDREPAVVLCDVTGGSPYNTTLRLVEEMGMLEKTSVVSGMNLPLLLVLLTAADAGRETVEASAAAARDSLRLFAMKPEAEDEEL